MQRGTKGGDTTTGSLITRFRGVVLNGHISELGVTAKFRFKWFLTFGRDGMA